MARILLVDGDASTYAALDPVLAQEGHALSWAPSGVAGLAAARRDAPDLVLLEPALPDGTDVLGALLDATGLSRWGETPHAPRPSRRIPVILLTRRSAERDRVRGFELGATDYVTKPFSPRELALRIRAVLRRLAARVTPLQLGRLTIDPEGFRAWVDGRPIDLTLLEFKLLLALHERRDRVLSRAELIARAWDGRVAMTTRTVDVHVLRLREKLGTAGGYVQTVRGVGYRMAAPPS